MNAPPKAYTVGCVSQVEANRLWLAVLERQGLAFGKKHRSVLEASGSSLGFHAARLPSPFSTALARVKGPSIADELFDFDGLSRCLVTVRCMRKTLHMLPEGIAQIAHTATRHYRARDAKRIAFNAGLTSDELSRLLAAILSILADNFHLGHREIEEIVSAEMCTSALAARAALKFAWETGHIVYRNTAEHWNRECRRFSLARTVAPRITTDGDQEAAAVALIRLYYERYGPATVRDAMWWSGLSQTSVLNGLSQAGRSVVAIRSPWCTEDLYLFEDAFEASRVAGIDGTGIVDFLAHEDVALKAYHQSRRRYLADIPHELVFNQIGEALPTILVDGQIAGVWRWVSRGRYVEWELFAGSGRTRKACARRAEQLTSALRTRYDG